MNLFNSTISCYNHNRKEKGACKWIFKELLSKSQVCPSLILLLSSSTSSFLVNSFHFLFFFPFLLLKSSTGYLIVAEQDTKDQLLSLCNT